MAKKILTVLQENFIFLLAKNKPLKNKFYLSDGTALSAYYLHHRYSEDLDFFSKNEIDIFEINAFLKSIKPDLKIEKLDFQQRPLLYRKIHGQEILLTYIAYLKNTKLYPLRSSLKWQELNLTLL